MQGSDASIQQYCAASHKTLQELERQIKMESQTKRVEPTTPATPGNTGHPKSAPRRLTRVQSPLVFKALAFGSDLESTSSWPHDAQPPYRSMSTLSLTLTEENEEIPPGQPSPASSQACKDTLVPDGVTDEQLMYDLAKAFYRFSKPPEIMPIAGSLLLL